MKLSGLLVSILALTIGLSGALKIPTKDNVNSNDVPVFVKSLKKLYQGPPKQHVTTRAEVTTDWITQKLDHFDSAEARTWKMRYMINDEHFKPGGPMFIFVGGEWDIDASKISVGHFVDLAKEHNGILFYTEHRYYGESKPTSDLLVENLKYLNVKQALADLAHFVEYQRETVADLANSKVIMAGGSYSATMVVWFKKLYPHLLNGGWASSAPLLAKLNFHEYMEVAGKSWRLLGGEHCYQRIQNGIVQLEQMIKGKQSAEVKAMLKLCNNFDTRNDLDLWTLFSTYGYVLGGTAQYQRDNDLEVYCDYLMSFEDDLSAMTSLWLMMFQISSGCVDSTYKTTLAFYADTTYASEWARPWYYQTCNEYGWYQTSASRNQPFGSSFPLDLSTTLCRDAYGPKYSNSFIQELIEDTNDFFGGMNPQVENVYITHGDLDPWSPMGHGQLEGATMLPNASHCADFGSISPMDSPEMRQSKERLGELVREWLAD
ncbi:putative serine protease K12H4.7 [Stomoxys calcitrans]|uniref:Serine protease K12H4.7 n=1 Tax=Stomoxys calcitrans TaxID=35570 RepID=A0A1I8QFC5_STOCA|nr:putative serine protease K12H4.7 [Stomoxys calcitrans]